MLTFRDVFDGFHRRRRLSVKKTLAARHVLYPDKIYSDKTYLDRIYSDNTYRTKYTRTKGTRQNIYRTICTGQSLPEKYTKKYTTNFLAINLVVPTVFSQYFGMLCFIIYIDCILRNNLNKLFLVFLVVVNNDDDRSFNGSFGCCDCVTQCCIGLLHLLQ